jgi:ribose transport system substrate-binding protein
MHSFDSSTRTLIFSFNAVATSGILKALRVLGKERNTVVVSHNYTPSTARELERADTPLLGTVAFYPEQYGRRIMDIAQHMLRKEQVPPQNFTEHRWIGKRSRS